MEIILFDVREIRKKYPVTVQVAGMLGQTTAQDEMYYFSEIFCFVGKWTEGRRQQLNFNLN